MIVEIKGEYIPTPKEFVKMFWEEFDSRDSAEILLEIMALREKHYTDWLLQLEYMSEDLTQDMVLKGGITREEIIEFCDELKEHLLVEFKKEN